MTFPRLSRATKAVVLLAALVVPAVAYAGLTSRVFLHINTDLTGTGGGLGTQQSSVDKDYSISLASGTGANQADKIYQAQRTITASNNEDLDLAGVLTDAFGASLTMVKLKGVIVKASASNANNVIVTRPAANGIPLFVTASDAITLRPGAVFIWISPDATGVAVTAGTGDLINFSNSGGGTSVVYDVVLLGTSS